MNRRLFLKASSALSTGLFISTHLSSCANARHTLPTNAVEFTHGVASGDPTPNALIIWTRALSSAPQAEVAWQLSLDESFSTIERQGIAQARAINDYTVKVDVQDLSDNQRYYYRFLTAANVSPTGYTRTLTQGHLASIRLAAFSCSNYPAGFFNPYMEAAKDDSIDVVIHLGDYIYEYGADGYATENAVKIGRTLAADNSHEILTLQDYRRRYATYRTDKGLQALHQYKPFIVVWDDHEIANDTYNSGAENHTPDEGDFFARRAAAVQAYYEWLPIRPPMGDVQPHIYRCFQFGDLMNLIMLDTRVIGRDKQLDYADYRDNNTGQFDNQRFTRDIGDANRTILGTEQRQWLMQTLVNSEQRWQVLGQQVLMGKMHFPAEIFAGHSRDKIPGIIQQLVRIKQQQLKGETLDPDQQARLSQKMPYNLDAWDGYPVEREMIYAAAKQANKKLLVLAGDTHNGWCNDLTDSTGESQGIEFATAGVSSPGMESYLSLDQTSAQQLAQALPLLIEDLQYCNLHQRGYLTLTLTHQEAVATWRYVDTVLSPQYKVADEYTQVVKA